MKARQLFAIMLGMGLTLSCTKTPVGEEATTSFTLKASCTEAADVQEETRTYIKNGLANVLWTGGDRLTVLPANGNGASTDAVKTAAATYDFTIEKWPAGATPKYAVFNGPAPDVATVSNDVISTVLKDSQMIYHDNSFSKQANVSVGELVPGTGTGYSVTMKNVCGLVQFSIGKYEDIESVTVEDKEGEAPLAGRCEIKMIEGEPVVTSVTNPRSGVKVECIIGSKTKFNKGKSYYICVLPGTFTPKFTMEREDGSTIVVEGKSPVEIKRAQAQDFGPIDNIKSTLKLVSGLYINTDTPDRSLVTGMTTASAGGTDQFSIKMGNGTSYEFTPAGDAKLRLIKDGQADTDPSIKGVICFVAAGYIKLPKVEGYTLTSVYIKAAATDKKAAVTTTCDGTPSSLSDKIPIYGEITLKANGQSSDDYYLYCTNGFRIGRMTLTYTQN